MKQKTYLDELTKNKEFKEKFNQEYRALKIADFKKILADIRKEYQDDPIGLKILTSGYEEMIKELEES